jgi:formate hydrogenlyase subunit 3/multisubunit Na+/H+ antiporter MnhD subunit
MNGKRTGGDFQRLPPLAQVIIGAFIVLLVIYVAIAFMDTWNKSVTPTLGPEGQQQTKEAQDRFWLMVGIVGIAAILIVVGIVLKWWGIL